MEDVKQALCKCLKSCLNQLTSAMTILMAKLAGKDMGQAIEYRDKSTYNVLIPAQNLVAFVSSRVKDNDLGIFIAPVIAPKILYPPVQNLSFHTT